MTKKLNSNGYINKIGKGKAEIKYKYTDQNRIKASLINSLCNAENTHTHTSHINSTLGKISPVWLNVTKLLHSEPFVSPAKLNTTKLRDWRPVLK